MKPIHTRSKGPELLSDLSDHIAEALQELASIEREVGEQLGSEIANRMAAHWGGQNIYFPMGLSVRLSKRDRKIFEEFTGDNHGDLARKYGVSLQWIYKIVKAVRREEMESRQGDMFS
ncbi:Mor transcription activator family protein [Chromobacterium piscinae]|uniref:Mor transcription activator family protein n=1 Tax=Chromobacterium piscinae TaxID=686831 RepID=UPI003F7CFB82